MSATLTLRAVARPSARRELVQALLAWAAVARREQPDLDACVSADLESPDAFLVVAHWESLPRLEEHMRSDTFGALLGGLDLLAHPVRARVGLSPEVYDRNALAEIRRIRGAISPLSTRPSGSVPDGRRERRALVFPPQR